MAKYYEIRTTRARELADFFGSPLSDLSANGLEVRADDECFFFGEDVAAFLRANSSPNDDGYITGDAELGASDMVLWVGGEPLPVDIVS